MTNVGWSFTHLAQQILNMIEKPTLDNVLEVVCKHFGVSIADLKSKRRDREYAIPRSVYFYIAIKKLKVTTVATGKHVNRDHATVIHGLKMYEIYGSKTWNGFPEGTHELWETYIDNSPRKKISDLEELYTSVMSLGLGREALSEACTKINDKIEEYKLLIR